MWIDKKGVQEIRENLLDDRVLEHRDSNASSSHGSPLEPSRSVDLGKHSVETHFPKDRNFEICQKTKITRAPCRRRICRVAEDAFAESYFVQNFFGLQQITKFSVTARKLETNIDMQSWDHPMDPVISVQNQNFSENTKELAKVLGASWEA